MSMGDRLWRLARRKVQQGLGHLEEAALGGPHRDARDELEDYLENPTVTRTPPAGPRAPSVPPPHPYETEYRLLGAPVGSSLETVRRCYRQRVLENHPDRYAGDPEKKRVAAEVMWHLNEAFERLSKYLEAQAGGEK